MMKRLILCLTVICVAADEPERIDPRGARPVEPNTRDEKCSTERSWPFCTDDEWGPKCPSGCRVQGLMDKYDHGALKRIERIRYILSQNEAHHRSADQVSKEAYDYLREKLVVDTGKDNSYYDLALNLRQRITDMKIKIDRQLRILAALKDRVKDQVTEMQRLEVDIDMKLRSCKGSCKGYAEYNVDRDSYVALEKQINQLESQSAQSVETVGTLYVMKSRSLQDVVVQDIYKSKDITAGGQRNDLFSDVRASQLILEQEGSSTSPATISKDSGTSLSSSSSSTTTSSSSSSSNPSITELSGHDSSGGFERQGGSSMSTSTSSQTFSCTRTIQKVITHTKNGPVETTEEVMVGGPECQTMTHLTRGELSGFFPSHTSSSSSSSSSTSSITTKSVDSTKGGVSKTMISDFGGVGFDLGLLRTDDAEEDTPDVHARGVKSTRVEREAHYVGKVCTKLLQKQDGRRSLGHKQANRMGQHCSIRSHNPLCSDDDWLSKCPSGCRLLGAISQVEDEVERKLTKVCQRLKTYKDAADTSMTALAGIYNANRRVIVNVYMSELKSVEQTEELAKNLILLRKRSARLSRQLKELQRKAQRQLEDLYRTEVDVDLNLGACWGSCRSVLPHSIDHLIFETLQTNMDQMGKSQMQRKKAAIAPPKDIPLLRLLPLDVGLPTSSKYKTIPVVQRELLTQFEDIGQNRVILEKLMDETEDVE
ncbi:uncharacterized protein LOC143010568 isoform X1 [Genypterus blacodes]|uniref:uncharacterized protein LOC143010568 isoform X1 n=1 Tax=Genypterus blacodes TaxID=154954 RepID=UPI003F7577D3